MLKREWAEMDALRKELVEARLDLAMERAMRRSPAVQRDLPPPDGPIGELSKGWDFNPYRFGGHREAYKACSSSVHHGDGWEKTSAQNPAHLYSSRSLALRAMRHEVGEECARKLERIDADIRSAEKLESSAAA